MFRVDIIYYLLPTQPVHELYRNETTKQRGRYVNGKRKTESSEMNGESTEESLHKDFSINLNVNG